jgi:LacI family transcriptional regulator
MSKTAWGNAILQQCACFRIDKQGLMLYAVIKFLLNYHYKALAMPTKVRLADIARASDVSPATVSLVLRNKPGIPEATRQRVFTAAAELGYIRTSGPGSPDFPAGARSLQTIGLLVKSDAGQPPTANPFYAHVLAGIEEACRTRHVNLLFAALPVDAANRPTAAPRLLATEDVDGLLVVGASVDRGLYRLLGSGRRPLVLVDAYLGDFAPGLAPSLDAALTDNFGGAVQAVEHLIALGHHHIGMVGGGADAYPSLRARREGYRHTLRGAGIAVEYCAECMPEGAGPAARALLAAHPHLTALFACNDAAALHAAAAAADMGRRIGGDLALIGFDDIDLAAHVSPPLTTMHVDKLALGRRAVELLADRVAYPQAAPVTTIIHPRLVVRGTTGPPAHADRAAQAMPAADA